MPIFSDYDLWKLNPPWVWDDDEPEEDPCRAEGRSAQGRGRGRGRGMVRSEFVRHVQQITRPQSRQRADCENPVRAFTMDCTNLQTSIGANRMNYEHTHLAKAN